MLYYKILGVTGIANLQTEDNSFIFQEKFILLHSYCATSISVAGLDRNDLPILLRQNPKKYNNIKVNYNQILSKISKNPPDQIDKLVLLPLHPNRVNEMHCLFDEQFRIEIEAKQNSDLMDDDNEDLFNDEARDEYDLDEGDNDYDI